jgi:hypothetical protein
MLFTLQQVLLDCLAAREERDDIDESARNVWEAIMVVSKD